MTRFLFTQGQPVLPSITVEGCKPGSACVKMIISEVINSHLTPSGEFGVFHLSQWRGDLVVANVTLCEKNSEGNSFTLLHQLMPKQPMCCYCQHWRIATKYWENLKGAPHTVRAWSVIPTAKIRGRSQGRFLRIIYRQYIGGFQWEHVSKTSRWFSILKQSPHHYNCHRLWHCYRDQAARKGSVCWPAIPLCVWGYWTGMGTNSVNI